MSNSASYHKDEVVVTDSGQTPTGKSLGEQIRW